MFDDILIIKRGIVMKYEIGKHPNSRKKRKYTVDDNYFSHPTLVNSYWAGFLAADGCITSKNNINKKLSLSLQRKDKEHIIAFSNSIGFSGPVVDYESHGNPQTRVVISSVKIANDLADNFNITPKKSLTLKPPNLTGKLALAFIVGYIDGDGTIGIYTKQSTNRPYSYLSVIGTKEVLYWVRKTLGANRAIYKKKNVYSFVMTDKSARKALQKLLTIKTPRLARKWKIADEILLFSDNRIKLSELNIYSIDHLYSTGEYTQKDIATRYGIHQVTVSQIVLGHGRYAFKNSNQMDTEEAN